MHQALVDPTTTRSDTQTGQPVHPVRPFDPLQPVQIRQPVQPFEVDRVPRDVEEGSTDCCGGRLIGTTLEQQGKLSKYNEEVGMLSASINKWSSAPVNLSFDDTFGKQWAGAPVMIKEVRDERS